MHAAGIENAASWIEPLVNSLAVPAFLLSPDHRIMCANTPFRSLLDAKSSDLLDGGVLDRFIFKDSADAVLRQLDLIRQKSAAVDRAMLPIKHAGVLYFFSTAPLNGQDGEILGFLCQSVDALRSHKSGQVRPSAPDYLTSRKWRFDVTGGGISHNPAAPSAFDMTDDRLLSDYVLRVHPLDRMRFVNACAALISMTEEACCLSYRVEDGSGTYIPLSGEGRVIRQGADGLPDEIEITETDLGDLDEHHTQTTLLMESELRWKTAVLSANQGVWDHDFERQEHFLSKTWRALRGLSEDDPVPVTTDEWVKTIHPNDLPHIQDELRRMDSGETDIIDYRFRQRHTDGDWRWFLSSGRIVRRDADGLPARIIGTDTDITDIKTVEIDSQRMAERLDVAMEAAGMARWEYYVNDNQAFWDDRLLKMFGVTDGQNLRSGDDWANFIHPEDRDKTIAYTEDRLRNKADVAYDYRLVAMDGSIRHIRTRGKFVDDAETGPRYYGVNFDITKDQIRAQELEDARARLEHESRHDALTGLANRRRLDDVFTEHMRSASQEVVRHAVLHFDIDHFKQINDTMGHDAGDATLKHAASVLLKNTPETALVSRVGGDEFVALLFDAPDDAVLEDIAERIIRDMSLPFYYGSQECNIGTSIGIALIEGKIDPDGNPFIDADLALYEAKKAGRGRYRFYNATMKEEARRRKNSFDALLAGFDQGEITCHYQPQFDAVTLELTGLEALVRWESARYGLIMPDEFLKTAEDMGLLAQFDELVLRRALYDMKKWQGLGLDVPPISVNVSAHRLNDPSLGERLQELDLPRGMLSFELLESAFLDARNDVIDKNLKIIGQMGIEIEIDDFGSGHASIASLLQISPQRLKIDRTLIQPIVGSERQRELVKTIIGIGRMLDIRVVAEGVETPAHVPILRDMGCCYLQGFGLSHPMDAKATAGFLGDLRDTQGRLKLA